MEKKNEKEKCIKKCCYVCNSVLLNSEEECTDVLLGCMKSGSIIGNPFIELCDGFEIMKELYKESTNEE